MAFLRPLATLSFLLTVSALVSACSSKTTPPPSGTNYRALADRATLANGNSSTLGGTELSGGSLHNLYGTLNHTTGATTLTDTVYSVSDPNGPDANGVMTDSSSTFAFAHYQSTDTSGTKTDRFPYASYRYVTAYDGQYNTAGGVLATGVYGVQTVAADIPTTGTARYSGQTSGSYTDASALSATSYYDLLNGSSDITADFAKGTAQVVLNNFSFVDLSTGAAVMFPSFDEVRLIDMNIASNKLTGGMIAFYKQGTLQTQARIIGSSPVANTGGTFFGYDPTIGAPDEVGGIVSMSGTAGKLDLVFLAD